MKPVLHAIEVSLALLGVLLILAAMIGVPEAEAAALALPSVPATASVVWAMTLGCGLLVAPVTRRAWRVLTSDLLRPSPADELSVAVAQVGLAQRVVAANMYLVDLPDEAWTRLFPTGRDLWAHFGPCYTVAAIRDQMHPRLRHRLETVRLAA